MTEDEIRSTIENCLRSYCRGIDRLHPPSIAAAFHPGAILIDYGPQPMAIETFVKHAPASLQRNFVSTQHRISNTTVKFNGDHAVVETYVHAAHVEASSEAARGRRLHTFVGRYIDRFEERNGVWKIARRTLRNDWSTVELMGVSMSGTYVLSGRGDSPDPMWD
jgi:SnoaL-like domain